VLGLVPVAFFQGEGSTLVQPIGQTVVGGLTVGTVMTLFVIPVIYAIVNRLTERREEKREERRRRRIEENLSGGNDGDGDGEE
jgi:HAE1 family hydrophobic/amphiphilic exporter-1